MRVLLHCDSPFFLAHGGAQIQIEQTKQGLEQLGVEVDWMRWYDGDQKADLINFFGTASLQHLSLCRKKGIKTIITTLLTGSCNRSDLRLNLQGAIIKSLLKAPAGQDLISRMGWKAYGLCDRNVVGLEAEKQVLKRMFGVPQSAISIVPLGLSDAFRNAAKSDRSGNHLICPGTITERKNSVLLAELARAAEVPILFVGKPYSTNDPYWRKFAALIDNKHVLYVDHISGEHQLIELYQKSRGCVVLSWYENWCLVAHEAAACGLPVLLPDQRWSRERFGEDAAYWPKDRHSKLETLRWFYNHCATLKAADNCFSWTEVAERLKAVYTDVLGATR